MRVYTCPACNEPVYFRNLGCSCGAELSYDPEQDRFVQGAAWCSNRQKIACNWIAEDKDGHCRSCSMTEIIPDAFRDNNVSLWSDAEFAKRWVLSNLSRWGWFTNNDAGARPRFHLLSEDTRKGEKPVIMGHADGLITINVIEADPVERERRRDDLSERLRTMNAHFRHEIAHFLQLRLSEDDTFLKEFRALFGDETADYGEALKAYYANGAPPDFEQRHVTRYASSHPHEDWAETAAHVMHLTDIVDSAAASGLQRGDRPTFGYDAYAEPDAEALISQAVDLGLALNRVNRSMGLQDLYPFVISPLARQKMVFTHGAISNSRRSSNAVQAQREFSPAPN